MAAHPGAVDELPRRGTRGRRAAVLIALTLGLTGLVISAIGVAVQIMPREFTAAQQQQIESWETASRWQELTAGAIFPPQVGYQLPARVLGDSTSLSLDALRVSIAPQSGCGTNVTTPAAAAVLHHDGCQAVLRATYTDATRSYVMTVGVAVLPSAAAASQAYQSLNAPRLTSGRDARAATLAPSVLAVRYQGGAAAMYNYSRQLSGLAAGGPYLIMYAAGYADSRPHVTLTDDLYSDHEMTGLAQGVASSVRATLAAPPARPHCPGTPGC